MPRRLIAGGAFGRGILGELEKWRSYPPDVQRLRDDRTRTMAGLKIWCAIEEADPVTSPDDASRLGLIKKLVAAENDPARQLLRAQLSAVGVSRFLEFGLKAAKIAFWPAPANHGSLYRFHRCEEASGARVFTSVVAGSPCDFPHPRGKERDVNVRFQAMASHYLFELQSGFRGVAAPPTELMKLRR